MSDPTWLLIVACWLLWGAYWLAMSFRTKRTVERGGFLGYRLVALAAFGALFAVGHLLGLGTRSRLWEAGTVVELLADILVLGGAAFSVWARVTLGRNWSAEVVFKQDHELIRSGPYALVRHPIYTGLLAMALGTAIAYGRALGFALFLALCAAFWWKSRDEERVMRAHFPDEYPAYRDRVHAIVPYLL